MHLRIKGQIIHVKERNGGYKVDKWQGDGRYEGLVEEFRTIWLVSVRVCVLRV